MEEYVELGRLMQQAKANNDMLTLWVCILEYNRQFSPPLTMEEVLANV